MVRTRTTKPAVRAKSGSPSSGSAGVEVTHGKRVVYPSIGITKQDVVDYYAAVASCILPDIAGRPLSLVRCPQGAEAECFFQKHFTERLGEHVRPLELREKGGKPASYITIDDERGLVELAQMNTIEFHVWGAHDDDVDRPDLLVFDLDPAPDIPWKKVVAAARDVRAHLAECSLESFVRLTGGKGAHVVVPIRRGPSWERVKAFCENVADALVAEQPKRFIATASKERREGLIFIDWLRNARGATSVASWSLRAKPGAPVAMPLRWPEFEKTAGSNIYDIVSAKRRASALRGVPWRNFDTLDQTLPDEC